MDPYLGMIQWFAGNFAPRGWMLCNGQLLAIAQFNALFALLGTTYGGNGVNTFGLPDLRGRVPIHFGQGPGLSYYTEGQQSGSNSVTVSQAQMPSHTHIVGGTKLDGNTVNPGPTTIFGGNLTDKPYSLDPVDKPMSPTTVHANGSGLPVSIVQPYLALTAMIATAGIFPSRN
jgi:microcystin-dependent protein